MAKWIKAVLHEGDNRSEAFINADTIRGVYVFKGKCFAYTDGYEDKEISKDDYDEIVGRPNHEKEMTGVVGIYKKIRNSLDEFESDHRFAKGQIVGILRKAYKEISEDLENVQEQQKRNV